MLPGEGSLILARSEWGWVAQAPCGCVHVTFGRVTVEFSEEEVRELAGACRRWRTDPGETEVAYGPMRLHLTGDSLRAFATLVVDAVVSLDWYQGRLEMTDEAWHRMRERYGDEGKA